MFRHDISMVFFFLEGERRNDGTPPPPFFPNLVQRTNLLLGSQKTWRLFKMKLCWKKQEMNYEGLYFFVAKQTYPYFGALLKAMIFFDPKKPRVFRKQILQVWSFLPACQLVTSRMTPYMFRILGIPKKAQKMPLLLGVAHPKYTLSLVKFMVHFLVLQFLCQNTLCCSFFFFDQFPPISHPNCWWKVR